MPLFLFLICSDLANRARPGKRDKTEYMLIHHMIRKKKRESFFFYPSVLHASLTHFALCFTLSSLVDVASCACKKSQIEMTFLISALTIIFPHLTNGYQMLTY